MLKLARIRLNSKKERYIRKLYS